MNFPIIITSIPMISHDMCQIYHLLINTACVFMCVFSACGHVECLEDFMCFSYRVCKISMFVGLYSFEISTRQKNLMKQKRAEEWQK